MNGVIVIIIVDSKGMMTIGGDCFHRQIIRRLTLKICGSYIQMKLTQDIIN